MSSEWQEHRLGDITRWVSGGTPSKQNPEYWGGSIPWISASSMKAKVCADSDERITEEAVRSGARMCDPGTILLLVRGSELHKRIPIGVAAKRVAFNQDVKAITTCSDDLSGDYLYYLLKGNGDFLLNSVEFTGIGAGKLETPFLQDLLFPIPTRKEQKVITDFMIALDDKIELNRKTNETLEAIAKALFKSWFVDFDPVRAKAEGRPTGLPAEISDLFPDSFEDSELGEIPSGWAVTTVGEVTNLVTKGTTPTSIGGAFSSEGIPFYKVESISDEGHIIPGKCAFIDDKSDALLARSRIEEGDILFSIAGTIGRVAQMTRFDIPANTNQALAIARPSNRRISSTLLFYFLRERGRIDLALSRTVQSVQANFSLSELKSIPLALPQQSSRIALEDIFDSLRKKISSNQRNSFSISALRDTLLPKLISGEIRIPDAEKMLEEVGI